MIPADVVKYRALKMAVATGMMPEVEFIWSVQRAEGEAMCFGQGLGCGRLDCRWRSWCMGLEEYAGVALGGASSQEVA